MTRRYILIDESLKDIRDHREYLLKEANSKVAHDFIVTIFEKFQFLANYPDVGKPRTEIKLHFLSFPVTRYKRTIFYKKTSTGVRILAVLGSYQDHKRHITKRN